MTMQTNIKIMRSMRTLYRMLVRENDFPTERTERMRERCSEGSGEPGGNLDSLDSQLERAQVLAKIAADRKNIVLQQLQIQNALKQESLAASMVEFSEREQKETKIAMQIMTVITLLILTWNGNDRFPA